MKTFEQLTPFNQQKAVEFARKKAVDLYKSGIIEFPQEQFAAKWIEEMAVAGAETALYNDENNNLEVIF